MTQEWIVPIASVLAVFSVLLATAVGITGGSKWWFIGIAVVLVGYIASVVATYHCDTHSATGTVTKAEVAAGERQSDIKYLLFVELEGGEVAVVSVTADIYASAEAGDTVSVAVCDEKVWFASMTTYAYNDKVKEE